jgi:hypothetical protein
MSRHSQSADPEASFLGAWERLVGRRGVPPMTTRRGRKPRVPLTQVLPTLIYHVMQDTGTLAEHLFQLFRTPLADSSWSDRRLRLPWEIFAELMRPALRARATSRQHRDAFWRGWRLVGLDGTQFNLINTPQVAATFEKARTRRGRAAFAKITTAVLLEIGLHNPLAAAVGRTGESEWALAQGLLAQLPKRALLLADRRGEPRIDGPWACSHDQQIQRAKRHRPVGPRFVCHVPETLVGQHRPFGCRERHGHDGQRRNHGESCHQSKQYQAPARDFERADERSQHVRYRQTEFQESAGAELVGKQKLLNPFRQKDCTHHEPDQQRR